MKNYKITQNTIFGKFMVCDWPAETKEQAVVEFLKANPAYANEKRGSISAQEKFVDMSGVER